jgi:class 3 adenylate cyclase
MRRPGFISVLQRITCEAEDRLEAFSASSFATRDPDAPWLKIINNAALATIMAADVFGYSRLSAENEEETLRTLKAHRAVIDRLIARHEGRIFNTAGDSVLAEV